MVVTDRIKERARHIQRYYHADGPTPYKYLITPEHLARARLLQPKYRFDDFPGDLEEFPASWGDASDSSGKNSLSGVLRNAAWTCLPTQSQPTLGQSVTVQQEASTKPGDVDQDCLAQDPVVHATAQLSLKDPDEHAKDDQSAISLVKCLADRTPAQTPWTDQQAEDVSHGPRNSPEQLAPDIDGWDSGHRDSNPWNTGQEGTGDVGDDEIKIVAACQSAKAPTSSLNNGESSTTQHAAIKSNSPSATSILKRFIADTLQVETLVTPRTLHGHPVRQPLSPSFVAPNVYIPPDSPFAMRVQTGPAEGPQAPSKTGPKKEFKYSKEQVAKYVKWCKKQQQKNIDGKDTRKGDSHMNRKGHDGKGKEKEI
ncbi:hypothetical protein CDV36_006453 [Fusarium kuroshium]|uniref:Uncharacterized protein n=1 Tax=Fusarium kuroshium TaxID=2010991 RepID=A0A3M2S8H3_9HYPO|nr:hypothetical protein CDV36_006453 [Fusarium kuroshium]